ncbi:MAG: rRNA maturation RNase YbeY [Sphingomonadales bacterium]
MVGSESKVYFFFEKRGFALKDRGSLKSFIELLFKKEKTALSSINYIFCSDKKLLEINKSYLRHNFFTDIISFDLSSGPKKVAEIYISIDRVRENARLLGVSFKSELHRVIFHGALHICGYKDKSKEDRRGMRKKEDRYLALFGIVPRETSADF